MVKTGASAGNAWHRVVPTLRNAAVTLREIKVGDAAALLPHLGDPGVAERPYPRSLAGMQQFVRRARERRRRGLLMCFVIIPAGHKAPVGILQLWPIDTSGSAAEFEVVIGRQFWSTGLFEAAVALMFQFAFDTLGVSRLEAGTMVGGRPVVGAQEKTARRARLRVVKR